MMGSLFPGLEHLQNIHPLTVHFPIAFLAGAPFFYALALYFRQKETLADTAYLLLILGVLSSLASVGTGLYAEPGLMVARSVRKHLLETHKYLMLATTALAILLAAWATIERPFPKRGRPLFLFLFLVMLGLMAVGGDFGARMVYDYNAGGNACPQPIEFTE